MCLKTEVGSHACSKRVSHGSQHKKLVEGTLYEEVTSASFSENDISNSLRNGILYLEDPIDHVRVHKFLCVKHTVSVVRRYRVVSLCDSQTWTPHYFVLTSHKIYYSEETSHYQTADEEEDDEGKVVRR